MNDKNEIDINNILFIIIRNGNVSPQKYNFYKLGCYRQYDFLHEDHNTYT